MESLQLITAKTNHHNIPQSALGHEIAHFPTRHLRFKRWGLLVIGVLLILSALLFTLLWFFDTWTAIETHGRAVLFNRLTLPLMLFLPIFLFGIMVLLLSHHFWQSGISTYQFGFVIQKGNKKSIFRWNEIDRLDTHVKVVKFGGSIVNVRIRIILEDQQNHRLTLRNRYETMDELISQMHAHILPILLSKARLKMQHDRALRFHQNISATKQGLNLNGQLVDWQTIKDPVIKNGILALYSINEQKAIFKAKVNKIKNLDLLSLLIKHPPKSQP